ncbi:hypothetical protein ZWY2020_016623 [Hordeum vulgare]|nr:hypothetical protein ZWY2020_016623 [Hordeum vulgare]
MTVARAFLHIQRRPSLCRSRRPLTPPSSTCASFSLPSDSSLMKKPRRLARTYTVVDRIPTTARAALESVQEAVEAAMELNN